MLFGGTHDEFMETPEETVALMLLVDGEVAKAQEAANRG